ncbi:MAG: O-antigen ligase family protein [Nitrospiraceae bacterium]|nr:O-antigen ligase family protein [Nitrospiraceae bacterium]
MRTWISNLKFQMPDFAAALVAIAAAPALLFGAVEYWAMAVSGALAIVLFMFGVFSFSGNPGGKKIALVYMSAALAAYLLFQMLPLPVCILGLLQPGMAYLAVAGPAPVFHSISVYPFETEMALARFIIYLMVFFTAALFIDGRAVYRVLKGLSVFGFALALFAIVQHFTWNGRIYWVSSYTTGGSPFGPFVDRNHFAGFVNMIMPLALAVSLASRELAKKALYAFFAVVMALAVVLSLSRGGVMSFIAGLAAFCAVLIIQNSPKWQYMVLALFSVTLVSFVTYAGASPLLSRFPAAQITHGQRLLAWKGTLAAFRDFPVFGTGLGTFASAFGPYQPAGLQKIWEHAHNDFLELLLEGGLAGVLLGAVFVLAVLKTAFGHRRGWHGRAAYLKAGFVASIITISVHSLADFNLHVPSNAILLSLILGLAVATSG